MRIAHLSDPHICRGPAAGQPAASLAKAVGRLLAIEPRPDCVLITGDLADTGHPEEYAALHELLRRCPVPVHLVAGNHDDPAALIAEFGGTPFLGGGTSASYTIEYPEATIIVTCSRIEGSPSGYLGPGQLSWLDKALSASAGRPAFVCVHHPPLRVGLPFMDSMRLTDAAEFGEVIGRHRHVARVLAGHVHRGITAMFAGTIMTIAPSTFRQTALRMHDAEPCGYLHEPTSMLLHVLDGTTCITHDVAVSHASSVFAS
ncbi:MAG TPA: phosphodiesterase [Streptosporangiaceae bacterium]|jgi:3',5'-cyclic AMP phosphodiesterase CpdA